MTERKEWERVWREFGHTAKEAHAAEEPEGERPIFPTVFTPVELCAFFGVETIVFKK
jgi:hypothetical protein